MVVKNDRKSSYFEELPPVGAPPSFLPSASVSQPKGNHNEEAYVIFDKSTTLFPKGGLSRIFFCFWMKKRNSYVRNSRRSKEESWISFDVSLESLLSLHFSKYWKASQRLGHPFLVFWDFFDSSKKIEKYVFCLTKVLKFLWIRPLYQRLCSLEEPKLKCFLNTFWATPLYLICERFIIIFPAQKGIVVLW